MPAARTAARGVALALFLGGVASGCGGDEPAPATRSPAPTGESSSGTGPTTESTGGPMTEPTTDEPTVTPAAGLLLEEETSQVNTPAGEWERIPDVVTYASAAGHVPSTQVISLSDRENFASPASLDEQVKFHDRTLPEGAIIRRQDNVMLDGAPAYYVQWWEKGDTKIQHDIGLDHDGRVISIQMDLDRADPAATEALVASVLASFRWR